MINNYLIEINKYIIHDLYVFTQRVCDLMSF